MLVFPLIQIGRGRSRYNSKVQTSRVALTWRASSGAAASSRLPLHSIHDEL